MLRCAPMLFSILLSILFYKVVTGVGGTVCVDFNKNLRRRENENKFSAAPSRSACDPEKYSSSSPDKSSSSLDVSTTFCCRTYLRLFWILISCSSENELQILQELSFLCNTMVVTLASFSARWTVIM